MQISDIIARKIGPFAQSEHLNAAAKRSLSKYMDKMVGETWFEHATLCSQNRCATRLRYSPTRKPSFRHFAPKRKTWFKKNHIYFQLTQTQRNHGAQNHPARCLALPFVLLGVLKLQQLWLLMRHYAAIAAVQHGQSSQSVHLRE